MPTGQGTAGELLDRVSLSIKNCSTDAYRSDPSRSDAVEPLLQRLPQ